jgi:hypothetical protein
MHVQAKQSKTILLCHCILQHVLMTSVPLSHIEVAWAINFAPPRRMLRMRRNQRCIKMEVMQPWHIPPVPNHMDTRQIMLHNV